MEKHRVFLPSPLTVKALVCIIYNGVYDLLHLLTSFGA